MIKQESIMGKEATIKVFGLFRSHEGQWAAMVPSKVPYDTRAGHDHRRRLERLPIGAKGRSDIMAAAANGNRDLRLIHRPDGKEYAFDRAVEFEYEDADLEAQRDLDRTHADFLADTGRV